jgi:hypothetical protein
LNPAFQAGQAEAGSGSRRVNEQFQKVGPDEEPA